MKKTYGKIFLRRGLMFGGFGPIIMGLIYLALDNQYTDFAPTGSEIFLGILSTYLLAFVQAGASVFNQITEWPTMKSLLYHFLTLYCSYTVCYLVNAWLEFQVEVIAIFTAVFTGIYLIIWGIVYLSVKSASKKMNKKLKENGFPTGNRQ